MKFAHRIYSILVLPALLGQPPTVRAADAHSTAKPNIIFILADDMGYSDIGWQGSPIQTPNLDKLRAGGMFLERNYAQPQCTPSRVAFLSGRYPYRYGLHEHIVLPWSLTGLPGDVKTVAEKLKEGGYETAIVGKWHVGGHLQSYLPQHQGFDHSFCCINGDVDYWNYRHYDFSDIIQDGNKFYASTNAAGESSGNTYATDLWKQQAIRVIRNHDAQRPLFMYLAFTAPHWPLEAPGQVLSKYRLDQIEPYWAGPNADNNRTAQNRRLYVAMVDALDSAIGQVVQTLKEENMLENTLIVFCSDNGGIPDGDNRPLRSVKGDSFEGGCRVPGIVVWRGKIKPGSTSSELVYLADWYPTFAEIAGLSVKGEQLDGVSALNVPRGGKGLRHKVPIISADRHALVTQKYSLVGGGSDYVQLIKDKLADFQLYDLAADVSQKEPAHNHSEMAQQMRQELAAHLQDVNRGYFDWDIKYNRDRLAQRKGDHNYESVVDDLPKLTVAKNATQTEVTISPVSKELAYQLQRTSDGKTWKNIAEFGCKTDAPQYTFASLKGDSATTRYRVQTRLNFGLPLRDAFSSDGKYKLGALTSGVVPVLDGFLPRCDVSGRVEIIGQNLVWGDCPQVGGALQLTFDANGLGGSVTRYFIEPHARGKLYASMLVQFKTSEASCRGEINWLRQEGWNGPAVLSARLSFQSDGIYLDHNDAVGPAPRRRLAGYDGRVVCVVFEFDLGTTGRDTLEVYLDPSRDNKELKPIVTCAGEFTLDRLQFVVANRPGSCLTIDELRLGTAVDDVMPKPEKERRDGGSNGQPQKGEIILPPKRKDNNYCMWNLLPKPVNR